MVRLALHLSDDAGVVLLVGLGVHPVTLQVVLLTSIATTVSVLLFGGRRGRL